MLPGRREAKSKRDTLQGSDAGAQRSQIKMRYPTRYSFCYFITSTNPDLQK